MTFIIILLFTLCGCSTNIDSTLKTTQQDLTGNIVSGGGGYMAYYDGLFYFANQEDGNRLYQMDVNLENKEKLSDKSNFSSRIQIQSNENKLFYLQNSKSSADESFIWTLYSYDLVQRSESKVLDKNICSYTINDDWIFFSTIDTKELYKVKLDGSSMQLLYEGDPYIPVSIQIYNDQLFYGWDEAIIRMNLDGTNLQSWPTYPSLLHVYQQFVYYINMFSGALCKFNPNENNTTTDDIILVDNDVLNFTISENVLYYTTIDNKIYEIDLNGNNTRYITDGTAPIVLGKYLFYYDINDKMVSIPLNK